MMTNKDARSEQNKMAGDLVGEMLKAGRRVVAIRTVLQSTGDDLPDTNRRLANVVERFVSEMDAEIKAQAAKAAPDLMDVIGRIMGARRPASGPSEPKASEEAGCNDPNCLACKLISVMGARVTKTAPAPAADEAAKEAL